MDDLNAFERQIRDEIQRAFVPARPVDVNNVVRTAATQSPKWRFQSMFSATKFVVAAAVLALFGGFLLTGVLTQQPNDDRLPAVGATASATTQAEPTEDATSEPEPTMEVTADDSTATPDLLPGVDLVTEEVEPGVYRVLSDGAGHDLRKNVSDLLVTPEGDAFAVKSRFIPGTGPVDSRAFQLGRPGHLAGPLDRPGHLRWGLLDGAPLLTGSSYHHVLGENKPLVRVPRPPDTDDCPRSMADGGCWGVNAGTATLSSADSEVRRFSIETLGLGPAARWDSLVFRSDPGFITSPADGTVWAAVRTEDGKLGFAAFDGTTWTSVRAPSEDEVDGSWAWDMAVDDDGIVWVVLSSKQFPSGRRPPERTVASFDGAAWSSYPRVGVGPWGLTPIEFAADGRVWFGALNVLDGTTVRGIDALGLSPSWSKSRREGDRYPAGYVRDTNGSTWLTVGEVREDARPIVGLYVISPEAVVATE